MSAGGDDDGVVSLRGKHAEGGHDVRVDPAEGGHDRVNPNPQCGRMEQRRPQGSKRCETKVRMVWGGFFIERSKPPREIVITPKTSTSNSVFGLVWSRPKMEVVRAPAATTMASYPYVATEKMLRP